MSVLEDTEQAVDFLCYNAHDYADRYAAGEMDMGPSISKAVNDYKPTPIRVVVSSSG